MEPWAENIQFERIPPLRRILKAVLINPVANYLPSPLARGLLRLTKSELAAANWKDPGGWRSMVISYEGNCRQIADKVLVNAGTISMALRNRRKLGAAVLAHLAEQVDHEPVQMLCLGAGPGHIITDAMIRCRRNTHATLVDLSSDAFDYGRQLASRHGLSERMQFIQGDVRNVGTMLNGHKPDVVKMLGICEYLGDQMLVDIIQAISSVMPSGSAVVFNTLTKKHGTDRFFRRVFGLHMIHRSRGQMEDLFARGGFGEFTSVTEPLGVYDIVIGRKT